MTLWLPSNRSIAYLWVVVSIVGLLLDFDTGLLTVMVLVGICHLLLSIDERLREVDG